MCKCAHASETCMCISTCVTEHSPVWACGFVSPSVSCLLVECCAKGESRTQINVVFLILWACVFMGMCFHVSVYLGMHRGSTTFSCNTSDTSCTAITGSSVRFTFCISITAHGGSGDITSHPRCQSGRIEGEAVVLLLLAPLLSCHYITSFSLFSPCLSQ